MVQETINEEIRWLEEQLEAKKKALSEAGGETRREKDIIKETIKEVAQNTAQPQQFLPAANMALSDDDAQKAAYELEDKNHTSIIENLVSIAFTSGILSALKVANSLKNPHLLDEFHDTLADKYYEKLKETKKINP